MTKPKGSRNKSPLTRGPDSELWPEIARRYVEEKQSANTIARAMRITEWHVLNVLKLSGVARRPQKGGRRC